MSGGAFSQATIFALSIQPYINASIIIQLLCIAIPSLERLQKEGGEEGKKKIASITRYSTVHDVEQAQDRVLQATSLEVVGQCFGVDERYGYGIAETVKQDNQKRKENFLAQFLNAPCVTKCLEHLTPPQPFLLLPRSSLSRIRRTQKPSQSASW